MKSIDYKICLSITNSSGNNFLGLAYLSYDMLVSDKNNNGPIKNFKSRCDIVLYSLKGRFSVFLIPMSDCNGWFFRFFFLSTPN